jgi:hypothetical protein
LLIDSFDEEPLPVDVADEVFAQVLDIVRYAEDSVSRGSADQIQALRAFPEKAESGIERSRCRGVRGEVA